MTIELPAISSLVVTAGFGQNFLKSIFTDPQAGVGLPYMTVDRIEYWSATTNDRVGATKIVEGLDDAVHVVGDGAARYYWARPRLKAVSPGGVRTYGEWYPASATGGVAVAQTALVDLTGYVRLPSGLIVQWGYTGPSNASGIAGGSFPLAFPNQCFMCVGNVYSTDTTYVRTAQLFTTSISTALFLCTDVKNTAGVLTQNISVGVQVAYIASGY